MNYGRDRILFCHVCRPASQAFKRSFSRLWRFFEGKHIATEVSRVSEACWEACTSAMHYGGDRILFRHVRNALQT